jgi:hypothetical protein
MVLAKKSYNFQGSPEQGVRSIARMTKDHVLRIATAPEWLN